MVQTLLLRRTFAALLLTAPLTLHAAPIQIDPEIVDSSNPVEEALHENRGRAATSIEGRGGKLMIEYVSSEAIQVYMVPLNSKEHFVPTDFLHFELPASDAGSVVIDLMRSPGWQPITQKWVIHLLTKSEETRAGFTDLAFIPASPFMVVWAGIRHLMTPEAYTPSSYHALRGYRVMNVQFSMALGVLMVLGAAAILLRTRSPRKLSRAVLLLLCMVGIYQLRFSMDLLRFTGEHLRGYAAGNYDEAGSVYQIADTLRELSDAQGSPTPLTVYVCRDGTNYKEKILRYMAYPIRISSIATDAALADFALVMDRGDWTFEPRTDEGKTHDMLRCDALWRDAVKLKTFPDGTTLYRLPRS